jgi:hypothetical protein
MCPFLEDAYRECYVANLTSGAIDKAIYYCGGEYGKCEIYGRLVKTRQGQEEKDTGMKTRGEGEEVSDENASQRSEKFQGGRLIKCETRG